MAFNETILNLNKDLNEKGFNSIYKLIGEYNIEELLSILEQNSNSYNTLSITEKEKLKLHIKFLITQYKILIEN